MYLVLLLCAAQDSIAHSVRTMQTVFASLVLPALSQQTAGLLLQASRLRQTHVVGPVKEDTSSPAQHAKHVQPLCAVILGFTD